MKTSEINKKIIENPEFQKLRQIGGHKIYHLEGDAYKHTMLVWDYATMKFGDEHFMTTVALLHDIGKIYTSIKHGKNDWVYPDHSTCGALKGILCKFIPEDDPMFTTYQWYIANHIKPLFWIRNGINTTPPPNESCNLSYLRDLALCDIYGSYSDIDQTDIIHYLEELKL